MLHATRATARAATHVYVAVDDDDPELAAYEAAVTPLIGDGVWFSVGPRKSLAGWTNHVAGRHAGRYRCLASLGDDHVPRTPGWDALLLAAIDGMGGTGIAYPDDKRRADIPEAVVISSDIVAALGWMCEPSLQHFRVDDVWADLGNGAGCLRYVPGAVVEHMHYSVRPGVARDGTYADAEDRAPADHAAYERWRRERMAGDIETVKRLRERGGEPPCPRHSP